jgi:hypothetical protein
MACKDGLAPLCHPEAGEARRGISHAFADHTKPGRRNREPGRDQFSIATIPLTLLIVRVTRAPAERSFIVFALQDGRVWGVGVALALRS